MGPFRYLENILVIKTPILPFNFANIDKKVFENQ